MKECLRFFFTMTMFDQRFLKYLRSCLRNRGPVTGLVKRELQRGVNLFASKATNGTGDGDACKCTNHRSLYVLYCDLSSRSHT